MIVLFKLIILNVIIVLALRVALSEGMILEKLGKYFEQKVEEGYKVFDLFMCPWCSGTLQSITAHAFAFGLGVLPFEINVQLFIRWPLVIFGSSFVSGMCWTIYLVLKSAKDKNDAEAEYFKYLKYGSNETDN